jgi:2-C-methyl-D-erythritol 2,4-cyclodiphosphate synthase
VIYHALCQSITSLTGELILCGFAQDLLEKDGITDSSVYLQKGMELLKGQKVSHVAISIEALRPRLKPHLKEMRKNIARVMGITMEQVGISATAGEGLTDFGCGDGVQCLALITTLEAQK